MPAEPAAAARRALALARYAAPVHLVAHLGLAVLGGLVQVARSSGVACPSMLLEAGTGTAQAALTLAGFAGTLFLLGPWVAAVVALAAVPALLAELSLSRRRARMVVEVGEAQRRELFYAGLPQSGQLLAASHKIRQIRGKLARPSTFIVAVPATGLTICPRKRMAGPDELGELIIGQLQSHGQPLHRLRPRDTTATAFELPDRP